MLNDIYSSLKILRHLDRIEDYLDGHGMPVCVYLYPTGRCNYSCRHCSGQYCLGSGDAELDYEAIREFLIQAKASGLKAVKVTGGEPLLYSSFGDLMPFLIESFDTGLVTNGSQFCRREKIEAVYGLTWLRISVDAATLGTYHTVHGVSSHWEIFQILEDAIGKIKNNSPRTVLGVSFVITSDNAHEIYDAARMAKDWGVDNIRFTPEQTPQGNKQLSPREMVADSLAYAKGLATDEFKVFIMRDRQDIAHNRPVTCYYSMSTCAITSDGGIYSCCWRRGDDAVYIDSVYDTSLRDAFRGRIPVKTGGCPVCWNAEKNRVVDAVYSEQLHESFP